MLIHARERQRSGQAARLLAQAPDDRVVSLREALGQRKVRDVLGQRPGCALVANHALIDQVLCHLHQATGIAARQLIQTIGERAHVRLLAEHALEQRVCLGETERLDLELHTERLEQAQRFAAQLELRAPPNHYQ